MAGERSGKAIENKKNKKGSDRANALFGLGNGGRRRRSPEKDCSQKVQKSHSVIFLAHFLE
jgi:hypothetical protein